MKVRIFFCLIAASFVFAQDKPSWIDSPQEKYPSAQFLTAIGTGDTRKAAENLAAASLSQIFQSAIKAEQTVNERYKELFTTPNQSTFEGQSDVTKNITISTDQTLYNIQYPESYTDNAGRTYVLAALERRPTAEIYEKKLVENEKQMVRYIEQHDASKDPVARYANMNAASVFSSINESLRQQLMIIMPGAAYKPVSGYDAVKVQQMLNDARQNLPFSIALTGDSDGRTTAIVKEMLSEMGFVTADKGAIVIGGDVSFQEIDLKRPEQYIRWSYKFSVVDLSGASIVSLNENGREGHMTRDEAVNRSLRTMKQKIKTNFGREINKYFDRMVKK